MWRGRNGLYGAFGKRRRSEHKGAISDLFDRASPCVCVKGEEGLASQTFHFPIPSQMWEILLPSLVICEIRIPYLGVCVNPIRQIPFQIRE